MLTQHKEKAYLSIDMHEKLNKTLHIVTITCLCPTDQHVKKVKWLEVVMAIWKYYSILHIWRTTTEKLASSLHVRNPIIIGWYARVKNSLLKSQLLCNGTVRYYTLTTVMVSVHSHSHIYFLTVSLLLQWENITVFVVDNKINLEKQ